MDIPCTDRYATGRFDVMSDVHSMNYEYLIDYYTLDGFWELAGLWISFDDIILSHDHMMDLSCKICNLMDLMDVSCNDRYVVDWLVSCSLLLHEGYTQYG
jgi:hypothetical protein